MIGRSRGRASGVDEVADAISTIVTWSIRNDVQQETMRRARCDLPPNAVWLLARIARCGSTRLTDLATDLGLRASTMNPQTKRLEDAGLVARKADPRDGRASLLYATRAGRALLERTQAARGSMLAELLADWPERDLKSAARLLARLADRFPPAAPSSGP